MAEFGATSTADEVLENTDLSGKTVFITGGYSGLGRETARAMAARGAHIIIAGRDEAKADAAAAEIRNETGNAAVETIACDLGSLNAVRNCGEEARSRFNKIDLLINNAGVMACPQAETVDGFEMQFGTNHLGHFLLTQELMPLVEKGDSPRIVNLSSRAHHFDEAHFDDPNFTSRTYDKWQSYGQAKTANIQFTVGLEKRYGDKGIHAYAVHPGAIMTNLGRHMSADDIAMLQKRIEQAEDQGGTGFKSIPQGAATTCWVATADELAGQGGIYAEDCHIAEIDDESSSGGVRSYALDPAKAEQLWKLSEEMTGVPATA